MHFEEWMELAVKAFEVAGVAILAVGSVIALARAAMSMLRGERSSTYERARRDVGRSILLGLEVLIIADIVDTITIDPALESALALALIVACGRSSASRWRSNSMESSRGASATQRNAERIDR